MNDMDEMGMETSVHMTLALCERSVNTESTGDYTLPDYQPEIRRVLCVTPTVLPPAKYIGGAVVELNGTVDYQVLYVGADGGLYSVPLSSEYHLTLPIEGTSEFDLGAGVTVWSDVVSEGVMARVTSPRKMSLRCRLRALIRAYGQMLAEERTVGQTPSESLYRRVEQCRNLSAFSGLSDLIPLHCEVTGVGEDVRVISAEATPVIHEVRMAGESAQASGEVILKLLVGHDNGSVETVVRNLPLSGEVEMEGAGEAEECRALGAMSEVSIEVEEGEIHCDMSVLIEVRGMSNREIFYTSELFSGANESVCEKETYQLPIALRCERRNLSQSERLPLSELSLPENCTVHDAFGSVIFDACEQIGQKYVLTGESRYWLLCEKDGEFSAAEIKLPLRYETEGCGEAPKSYAARGSVLSCRARIDGETLSLDAELAIMADFVGAEEISAVREVQFGDALKDRGSRMTVYYPAPSEDAWAVAKKYHVSPEKISKGSAYYYF